MPTDRTGTHEAPPVRQALSSLRPYLSMLGELKGRTTLIVLLMLASTAVGLAIPLIAGRYIDALMAAGRGDYQPRLLALLACGLVLQLAGSYFYSVHTARLGLAVITRLRSRVASHLIDLPCLYFTKHRAGDLSTRMTSDIGSIQYMLTTGLIAIARAMLTIIGALYLMFHLNVRLSLVVVAIVPLTALIVQRFGHRLQRLSREMYNELGDIGARVQEVAGSIRIIKVYNNQRHELGRLEALFDRFRAAGDKRAHLTALLDSLVQIMLWICLITIIVYGFELSSRGLTSEGVLVSFFLLAYRLAMPIGSLTSLYGSAQGAVAAAGRLDEILSQPPESAMSRPTRRGSRTGAAIRLEHVDFSYSERSALKDICMEIAPGRSVGIVGSSGAGKTTLAGLVMRLFDPESGEIYCDDRPYSEYALQDLRGRISYVSQEPVIHDTSLEDNIRFGLDDASIEQVREAARQADILAFIETLPDGLATPCGERGVRLSGGERQRIALARAFLRDPDILILDEPTSSLDAKSETSIREAVTKLMRGRTAIIIAHRFSLVRDLDEIFVMDDGRVVEQGRHRDLMAADGYYSHLYSLQNREH